jgi:hypothetical protein
MRRLTISEWAAIGEIIGTGAVIVSLIFVVYSVNQNTAAVQGSTENLIFERHSDLTNQFMSDASLAAILVKMRNKDHDLTEIEAIRWEKYQLNLLDVWALAFNRHRSDQLGDDDWEAWNRYFIHTFSHGREKLSESRWKELRYGYAEEFWNHVGTALFSGSPD